MPALFLDAQLVRTPDGYRALIRREGWSDKEALENAVTRIDTLERVLCKYIDQQAAFLAQVEKAEYAAELASFRENYANERTAGRDETIGKLEARLAEFGVVIDHFNEPPDPIEVEDSPTLPPPRRSGAEPRTR